MFITALFLIHKKGKDFNHLYHTTVHHIPIKLNDFIHSHFSKPTLREKNQTAKGCMQEWCHVYKILKHTILYIPLWTCVYKRIRYSWQRNISISERKATRYTSNSSNSAPYRVVFTQLQFHVTHLYFIRSQCKRAPGNRNRKSICCKK